MCMHSNCHDAVFKDIISTEDEESCDDHHHRTSVYFFENDERVMIDYYRVTSSPCEEDQSLITMPGTSCFV